MRVGTRAFSLTDRLSRFSLGTYTRNLVKIIFMNASVSGKFDKDENIDYRLSY